MTKVDFLDALKKFTLEMTADLIMPVAMQQGDKEQAYRAAEVYLMSLPDSTAAKKKVPYILHQVLPGRDIQPEGKKVQSSVEIRSIFAVCSPCKEVGGILTPDKEEGGLILLNLMERLRISLLKTVVIGKHFMLDLAAGIDAIPYPDNEETALTPYCAGEMRTTWKLPAVERKEVINCLT